MSEAEPEPAPERTHPRRRRQGNRGFTLVLVLSAVAHAGLFGLAMFAHRRQPPRLDLSRAIPVQLVKLGKPRDPKLLPRKVEPPPPPPTEGVALGDAPKDKPKPKDKPPEKRELSDAARRLLEAAPREDRLERALDRIEEAEGDPEGDERGTTTDATNRAAGYQAKVGAALQASYTLPEAIPAGQRQFLKARVVLFIEPSGKIRDFAFVERHPNGLFMTALESLLRSIELPPPPPDQAKVLAEDGIEVIFRP